MINLQIPAQIEAQPARPALYESSLSLNSNIGKSLHYLTCQLQVECLRKDLQSVEFFYNRLDISTIKDLISVGAPSVFKDFFHLYFMCNKWEFNRWTRKLLRTQNWFGFCSIVCTCFYPKVFCFTILFILILLSFVGLCLVKWNGADWFKAQQLKINVDWDMFKWRLKLTRLGEKSLASVKERKKNLLNAFSFKRF